MSKRKIRKFNIDGIEMQFSFSIFNEMFDDKVYRSKRKVGEIEEELAETVFVEKSTVHTWRNGNSGPGDIDKIQSIAKYFNCEYLNLMTEVNSGDEQMNINDIQMTEREIQSVNKIYTEMLDYLRLCEKIYNKYVYECEIMDKYKDFSDLDVDDIVHLLNTKVENIKRSIENEMIFLSRRTYDYMQNLLSILQRLSLIKCVDFGYDENNNFNSMKVIELNEDKIQKSFFIHNNMFFGTVKEMLYG